MAVYTTVHDDELRAFLADYDVGELHSYKGIAEGVENTNYIVHTSKASYILTLYEARVNEEDLPFFLGLMEHLAEHGLNCPLPVHDKAGKVLKTLAGRRAVMITFLEGVSVHHPAARHCEQLGEALASLHLAGLEYDGSRKNSLSLPGWRKLADEPSLAPMDVEIRPGLEKIIKQELVFLETSWPRDLPRGIIHADLFPDNVFFLADDLSGLIDFYFACTDFLAYDLAICLNAWCFESDGSFNPTRAKALLRGYERQRPLSKRERTNLPLLARGAALRFLLTRIYDWLNTPADAMVTRHDPGEYLRKLRFHQQINSVDDYGF